MQPRIHIRDPFAAPEGSAAGWGPPGPMQLLLSCGDRCPACDGWGAGRRVRIGILTKVFTAELVDAAIAKHGRAERRRRLLPARLVVYFIPGPVPLRPGVVRRGATRTDQRYPRQPGPRTGEPVVVMPGASPAPGGRAGDRVPGGGRAARHTGHGLERGGAGYDCSPRTAPNSTFRIRPAVATPSTAPPPPGAFPSGFPRSGQWSWPKSERKGFSTLLAPDPAQPAPSREVRSPLWLALAEISPR